MVNELDPRTRAELERRGAANVRLLIANETWVGVGGQSSVEIGGDDIPRPSRAQVERWLAEGATMSTVVFNRDRWLVMGGCDPQLAGWGAADLLIRLAVDGAVFTTTPTRRVGASALHTTGRDRLLFLEKQASEPRLTRFHSRLAALAESTAVDLIEEGDLTGAAAAVRLAQRLGSRPPSSRMPAWSLARPWVPGLALLRLQTWWRRTRNDCRGGKPVETA